MKPTSILLTVYLFWIIMAPALAGPALVPHEITPADTAFNLPDLKDGMHSLEDYHGKVVLVNFWVSWCPPCIQEMAELERRK